jgi:hypothetical protein
MRKEKRAELVLTIIKEELKKEKREKAIFLALLSFVIILMSILLIFLSTKLILTGYASYIEAKGGYITEVAVTRSFPTYYWHGLYGLALRVSGFTEVLSQEVFPGEITRQDLFFDCIQSGVAGGNEIYASTNPSILWESLQPATFGMIDSFTGCSGTLDCAATTFTENGSILLGSTNITDIPFTHTYRYDGQNDIFDIGVLNDSVNLVFVSHINSVQRSYNYEKIVNFQMLLPTPYNSTVEYYFFTDPNDNCPAGGAIGENINATVYGHVTDSNGNYLSNASVTVAGYYTSSDLNGFYNLSFAVISGTYNLIAQRQGYDTYFTNITVNFTQYNIEKNITLLTETPWLNQTVAAYVSGYVFDSSGGFLQDVNVSLGSRSVLSAVNGYYSIYTLLPPGPHPIIAIKTGYNNYYYFLNFNESINIISHNITMVAVEEMYYEFPTGPYSTGPYTAPPGTKQQVITAQKRGEDFWVSTKEIRKEVRQNTFVEETIGIYNFQYSIMNLVYSVSSNIADFVKIDKTSGSVAPNAFSNLIVTIYGTRPIGSYNGTVTIGGSIERVIPVYIKVVEKKFPVETLLMEIDLFKDLLVPGENLKYKLNLKNLIRDQSYKVDLHTYLREANGSKIYWEEKEEVEIVNSLTLLKDASLPKDIPEGEYSLVTEATYLNLFSSATANLMISKPIYSYSIFGIPLWLMLAIISFFSFILLNVFLYKRHKEKQKRYRIALDYGSLPKPGDRVVKLGKIAESNLPAYYELEKLTTHCIVAGATGMGKSISAQVLIEEALMNNIAVIVFDPTAQWSGMLRKCDDKRMMAFYPKFGLKESDARAFKGNVRQIKNALEVIDIKKFMNPGQIQIFSLNKLDPKDIDIFVASVIRQIFKSDPQESPNLKLLLVFDEVHRLLSKFGGSGQGFLQVERSCREFRKWGLGVVLISQVLSDFVGEIKANINTEIQTRTIEESDLERIRTKYGGEFLKSLVRAEVGVAMFQNAEYNKGRPYFISFRPILHNTRRLPDEELEKYNKYNEIVDDLEYQTEQLEAEKIDTFDLRMELKLVKDKIMTGNFSVVEIYLEGLIPRVEKEWEKLGKKPKKRELELVEAEEIKKSIEEAKKERAKFEAEEAKKQKAEEKKEVKEENIEDKQAKPLTFDNGIMVSSIKELKSVLPAMDEEIFQLQVNDKKNGIADWLEQILPKESVSQLRKTIDKKSLIAELENLSKKKDEKKEKEENKGKEKEAKDEKKDEKESKEKGGELKKKQR